MTLIFEACQGQQHFLSILVTQNSAEGMKATFFIGMMQQNSKTKDWGMEERTQGKNFEKKTILIIEYWVQIFRI